jgi:hypothetical protein
VGKLFRRDVHRWHSISLQIPHPIIQVALSDIMHEDIKITDEIYAPILSNEVKDRIGRLVAEPSTSLEPELIGALSQLSNAELAQLMVVAAQRLST